MGRLRKLKGISDKKLKSIEKYLIVGGESFLKVLCCNYILPEWFLYKFKDFINWSTVCFYQDLSQPFIESNLVSIKDHYDGINFLSRYQNLSLDFMEKNKDEIEWDEYTKYNIINKEIVSKFYSYLNLAYIRQRNLLEEFITEEELDNLEIMHRLTK